MLDSELRELERAAKNGTVHDKLAYRAAVRNAGGSLGLDLSIPHRYELVHAHTYELSRLALQEEGNIELQPFVNGKPRPLSAAELILILAREPSNSSLWDLCHSTSTGIAYPANKNYCYKLVPVSTELCQNEFGKKHSIATSYGRIEGIAMLGQPQQRDVFHTTEIERVVEHDFWQIALQPNHEQFTRQNRKTLKLFAQKAAKLTEEKGMTAIYAATPFFERFPSPRLYPLCIDGIEGYHAFTTSLQSSATFIRVVPRCS